MKELDKDRALARVGGDATLLAELAGLFLEEYPRLFEELNQGQRNNDQGRITAAAHQLKGLFGQFGAEGARIIALNIESAARAGHYHDLPGLIEQMQQSLGRMEPELREMAEHG